MLAEFTPIYLDITLHAQIQQIEIHSRLYPPVSESLIIYAGAAIFALMDERIHEMNHIFSEPWI